METCNGEEQRSSAAAIPGGWPFLAKKNRSVLSSVYLAIRQCFFWTPTTRLEQPTSLPGLATRFGAFASTAVICLRSRTKCVASSTTPAYMMQGSSPPTI